MRGVGIGRAEERVGDGEEGGGWSGRRVGASGSREEGGGPEVGVGETKGAPRRGVVRGEGRESGW